MKYLVKVLLVTSTAMTMLATAAFGATVTATPNQLPKGAYVNGGDGDQQWIQTIKIAFNPTGAPAWAAGDDIVINLPTDVTVAKVDPTASYADHVYRFYETTGNGIDTTSVTATASSITIDLTTLDAGGITAASVLYVTFPVETDSTGSGSVNYTVDFPSGKETEGDQASAAVTFEDTIAISGFSFAASYTGNDDQSDALGALYPSAAADINNDLGDLVEDNYGAASFDDAVATWGGLTLDGITNNAGEPTFQIWASQTPSLKRVDTQSGHLPLDLNDAVITLTPLAEGDAAINTQLNGRRLDEGYWFFYMTSSVTGDWVIASSDSVDIRHWPAFDVTNLNSGGGVDYDFSSTYDDGLAGADNVDEVTLESGGTIGIDGDLASTNTDNIDIFWNFEDVDDNATIQIFLATDPNYDEDDLILSGPQGSEVIKGLGTGFEITPAPILEESATESFNYDVYTDASTYETASDYTVYLVTNDSSNQQVFKVIKEVAGPAASPFLLKVKHYPYIKFDDTYGSSPIAINTSTDKYMVINWGKDPNDDKDADGNATIDLYYSTLDLVTQLGAPIDPILPANITTAIGNGTLIESLMEDPDEQSDNRHMWDVRNAGLTAATDYFIYAHISQGGDGLLVQYTAAGGPSTNPATDRALQVTHDPYFSSTTPVYGETIELEGSDRVVLTWNGFDVDAATAGNVQILAIPDGATAPADYTAAQVATDDWYWLHNPAGDGSATGGATAGPTIGAKKFVLDVSKITNDTGTLGVPPSGHYDVYYFYTYAAGGLVGADTPVQADGVLRFLGSSAVVTNFELNPSQAVLSKGDTLTVAVLAESNTNNAVSMLAISLNVPSTYFTIIDQGGGAPFINESANYNGDVLQNEMTSSGGYYYLDFVEQEDTPTSTLFGAGSPFQVASFQVVASLASSGTEFIDNLITFNRDTSRATDIVDDAGQTEVTTVPIPAGNMRMATPGSVKGQVDLEAQGDVGKQVQFHVMPPGSFTPISDADFLAANGGANADGSVTITLGTDGAYELASIPTGDYDVMVHRDGYLNRLRQNVAVRPLKATTVDFLNYRLLLGGDVAGYNHDGDISTFDLPDNEIDATDITVIGDAFGAIPTDPNWNPLADVDGDGKVYIVDFNLATTNAGSASEGLIYKLLTGYDPNENVIARLVALEEAAGEVTYAVQLEDLSSLHAYAVEMVINTDEWELVSFSDGLADYHKAASLQKARGYDATFASGIIGRNAIRESEVTLLTLTLKPLVGSPEVVSLSEVTLLAADGSPSMAVISSGELLPTDFTLSQNFPNPFNPTTTINFSLPDAGEVKLAVYNLLGQEVRTLATGKMEPGSYKAIWNSRDNLGRKVSTGMYFYRLVVDNQIIATKKMVLLK